MRWPSLDSSPGIPCKRSLTDRPRTCAAHVQEMLCRFSLHKQEVGGLDAHITMRWLALPHGIAQNRPENSSGRYRTAAGRDRPTAGRDRPKAGRASGLACARQAGGDRQAAGREPGADARAARRRMPDNSRKRRRTLSVRKQAPRPRPGWSGTASLRRAAPSALSRAHGCRRRWALQKFRSRPSGWSARSKDDRGASGVAGHGGLGRDRRSRRHAQRGSLERQLGCCRGTIPIPTTPLFGQGADKIMDAWGKPARVRAGHTRSGQAALGRIRLFANSGWMVRRQHLGARPIGRLPSAPRSIRVEKSKWGDNCKEILAFRRRVRVRLRSARRVATEWQPGGHGRRLSAMRSGRVPACELRIVEVRKKLTTCNPAADRFESQALSDFQVTVPAGQRDVELCVRDHECEDGDRISVTVNGAQVFSGELGNSWSCQHRSCETGVEPESRCSRSTGPASRDLLAAMRT